MKNLPFLFLQVNLVQVIIQPPISIPHLIEHTHVHTLLSTRRLHSGAALFPVSRQTLPAAGVGSTCVLLLCVCLTHSQ